ncbi:MAG: methyltransferase domain-containing protein [Deltaproteobacteria bacterium]|nr:methyltransferase domain-containing protein [Deltaproteobacteria bacterium]
MYKEFKEMYTEGDYLAHNPDWGAEESPWKAEHILKMLKRHRLEPKTICEVGCGAGEILGQLQRNLPGDCRFYGYDISPQALELCQTRANEALQFKLGNILAETDLHFDLLLLIDLIEHLEDYYGFLRAIKPLSTYKIFHIPLDLSLQALLRVSPLLRQRREVGHIHYFNKEIALLILRDTGYEILDCCYTPAPELPAKSWSSATAKFLRRIASTWHEDWAARLLGGLPLLVLAK